MLKDKGKEGKGEYHTSGWQRVSEGARESGAHPLEERGNLQQVFEFVGGCHEPEPVFNWVRRRKSRESGLLSLELGAFA